MPQDELWATSARLTGYSIRFELDPLFRDRDALFVNPVWSKNPPGSRRGDVMLDVPSFARDYIPDVIRAVHFEMMSGHAKHVPAVAGHELRRLLSGFREGAIH